MQITLWVSAIHEIHWLNTVKRSYGTREWEDENPPGGKRYPHHVKALWGAEKNFTKRHESWKNDEVLIPPPNHVWRGNYRILC